MDSLLGAVVEERGKPLTTSSALSTAAVGQALFSPSIRPLRFAFVGVFAGLVQLSVFSLLILRGVDPVLGNALAFLGSVQLNFLLSSLITWRDRGVPPGWMAVPMRWARFHAVCAVGAAVNFMTFFMLARGPLPALVASGAGILAGAAVNYAVNDRVVFRRGVGLVEGSAPQAGLDG
jgi:dolichol-phosphate mannosyltransferase